MLIIHEDVRSDVLAVEFVVNLFADEARVVNVSYGDAIVKKNDLVRTQQFLSDGRRVRVDHVSPQSRGESGCIFVSIERVVGRCGVHEGDDEPCEV